MAIKVLEMVVYAFGECRERVGDFCFPVYELYLCALEDPSPPSDDQPRKSWWRQICCC